MSGDLPRVILRSTHRVQLYGSQEDGRSRNLLLLRKFFSSHDMRLGDRKPLEQQIHEITEISVQALRGSPLSTFNFYKHMSWEKAVILHAKKIKHILN
jgi:hypothetical protein